MALRLCRLSFVAFALSLRLWGFGLKANSCKNSLWLWILLILLIWKWIHQSTSLSCQKQQVFKSRMPLNFSAEFYALSLYVLIVLLYRLLGLLFRLCLYYLFFWRFPRMDWKANSRFSSAFWTLQNRPTLSLTLQSFVLLRVFSSFFSFSAGFSSKLTKKHWVSELHAMYLSQSA